MIIHSGKAGDYTYKALLYALFWVYARPIEQLEAVDFCWN